MSEQIELPTGDPRLVPAANASFVQSMMESVMSGELTQEKVLALKELGGIFKEQKADDAKREFAEAFGRLQANMPKIAATKAVPNNDGTTRYAYAPFEAIMAAVQPLLIAHGFSVSFDQDFADNRIIVKCTLTHVGGHERTNSFAARLSKPPGSSDTQGDGSTATYAKRFALAAALNIVIDKDSDGMPDAKAVGAPITFEQVQFLRDEIKEIGGKEETYLKLAGVTKLEDVGDAVYPVLIRAIQMRKARG